LYRKLCFINDRAMRWFLAAGTLLLFGLGTARSATPPPPAPFKDASGEASAAEGNPTTHIRLGAFKVAWEATQLAEVSAAIGAGSIQHQGDAGESIYWLCYTIAGRRAQRIWLIADGEMGGPEHLVTNFAADESGDGEASRDCPGLPKKFLPVTLDHGIWIGADENSVSKAIHTVPHAEGPLRSIEYQSKVPGNCEGGVDQINWLDYRIDHGRVTVIWAGQVTSC
jgi:hypothetical protein